jgi:ABC-type multidrug transport system ATPase subunit
MSIEISVKGPRGAGKSVLARHLAEYLKDQGHKVRISGTVNPAHSNCTLSHDIVVTEQWGPAPARGA